MAIFKIVDNKYENERDLCGLIYYVLQRKKCAFSVAAYLIPKSEEIICNQMLYSQRYKGKSLSKRAWHFVITMDSQEWERFFKLKDMCDLADYVIYSELIQGHQQFCAVHTDTQKLHFHWIVNPVNYFTDEILHFNITEFNRITKDIALKLYMDYGLALQGISYIREDGKMVFGREISPFLYRDRKYPYTVPDIYKLREKQGL